MLLNIIENSEASQQSYRSESNIESFNIHDNYSTQSNYNNLYQNGFHATVPPSYADSAGMNNDKFSEFKAKTQ